MQLPPVDIHWFAAQLTDTASIILDAWHQRAEELHPAAAKQPSSDELQATLEHLIRVLKNRRWQHPDRESTEETSAAGKELNRLGENGLQMLTALFGLASELGLEPQREQLERLALTLALWVIRRNGRLKTLELVVNAIARIANATLETEELHQVFHTMSEILDASTPNDGGVQEEIQVMLHNPRDLLLLNRAIVATRALSPQLMEVAFADVAEQLPDAAPGFFKEGMEQVLIQNYPDEVETVIERFHLDHPAAVTLH